MNAWLDANADGLAFMFWVFVVLAAILVIGMLVEFIRASGMRQRAARREALRRYCDTIVDRCCWPAHKTEGKS